MLFKQVQGLKFPDEYIVRFFFKEKLNLKKGRVLELGCGNGNNLTLFYQYKWNVIGIDYDPIGIQYAKKNFDNWKKESHLKNSFNFIPDNMLNYVKQYKGKLFDVLLLPSSIYYLPYSRVIELFNYICLNNIISKKSLIFLRVRTPKDYRYKKGMKVDFQSYKLSIKETGEHKCTITFLTQSNLLKILYSKFKFEYHRILKCQFENYQSNKVIKNSDIIFWGKISKI